MVSRVDPHTLSALQTATSISFVVATAVALPIIFAVGSPPLAAAFATVGLGSLAAFMIVTYLKPKHKRLPTLPRLPHFRRSTESETGLSKAEVIRLVKSAPKWKNALDEVNKLLDDIDQKTLRDLLQMIAENLPSAPGLILPPFGKETAISALLKLGLSTLEISDKSVCSPLACVLLPVLERRGEAEFKVLCEKAVSDINQLLEGDKSKDKLIKGLKKICSVA